jgi:hypothetical protein
MNRFIASWIAWSVVAGSLGTASAFPAGELSQPDPAWRTIASFEGVVPTEANPITGEKRLARMRRDGKLPDTFLRGRCTYNLAGDTGAAYYVKTCR